MACYYWTKKKIITLLHFKTINTSLLHQSKSLSDTHLQDCRQDLQCSYPNFLGQWISPLQWRWKSNASSFSLLATHLHGTHFTEVNGNINQKTYQLEKDIRLLWLNLFWLSFPFTIISSSICMPKKWVASKTTSRGRKILAKHKLISRAHHLQHLHGTANAYRSQEELSTHELRRMCVNGTHII